PARGTWSRKFSPLSCSIIVLLTPSSPSASARQSPTGPAPMISTRSDDRSLMPALPAGLRGFFGRSLGRHDVLYRAHPAIVGDVEDNAVRVLIFALVERVGRSRAARHVGRARLGRLLLGLGEVVDPHAEMIDAHLFLVG